LKSGGGEYSSLSSTNLENFIPSSLREKSNNYDSPHFSLTSGMLNTTTNNHDTILDSKSQLSVATTSSWKSFVDESKISNHTLPNGVVEFEHQPGVVIVTKIHGPHQLKLLKQSVCLLQMAYNRRTLYDIIVFTTIPVTAEDTQDVQQLVEPAKLIFVIDNDGLQNMIQRLQPEIQNNLLRRCRKVDSLDNITWWSDCPGRLGKFLLCYIMYSPKKKQDDLISFI
jgi:hypothetical protein